MNTTTHVDGSVAPGFEEVRTEFERNSAGGSFAFADPDAHVGYAYVMNKLDFFLQNDPREKALRDAAYRAIGVSSNRWL